MSIGPHPTPDEYMESRRKWKSMTAEEREKRCKAIQDDLVLADKRIERALWLAFVMFLCVILIQASRR